MEKEMLFELEELDPRVKEVVSDVKFDEYSVDKLTLMVTENNFDMWLKDKLDTDFNYRLGYSLVFEVGHFSYTDPNFNFEVFCELIVEGINLEYEGNLEIECGICHIHEVFHNE